MVNARITAVLTKNNRPISPDILVDKFNDSGIILEDL